MGRFKDGRTVKIIGYSRSGRIPDMMECVGRKSVIQAVDGGGYYKVLNWWWHADDLILVSKENTKFKFDQNELIT